MALESSTTTTARLTSPAYGRTETPPMATALPSIDFGFESLKERMNQFTIRFDEFIAQGRHRILQDKNDFEKTMAELKDQQKNLHTQKDAYTVKEQEIREQVARETDEMQATMNELAKMERKGSMGDEYKASLLVQIEETKQAIEKKRAIRSAQRQQLAQQQSKNAPELAFWEDHLGMRIDGAGVAGHLKITYTHLSDPDQESWFVVSVMNRDYEVLKCRPRLNEEDLTLVVDKLNETRAFSAFLKDMRQLFKNAAQGA
ncbi:chromosome segregation protein Spc25-domain-containing protein [Sphaerosporella brunnea]|uniref:Kinetochore protein SPC25 n=1 Tax=Sphaerosporella brunnea TaxID=1250544 RepID=A0A5J5EDQ0_9PEZI|nr:chromosome segregation protein Spc25-domain-containing protein [Sphaerosporella brunnea]